MASADQPTREVAEASLDFLAMEMVEHMLQSQTPHEPAGVKLEATGYAVGQRLAERTTASRPPLADTLDVVKFVCKEFWYEVFRKQVDNLRTNHRGVYVLQDNRVRWLARLSPSPTDSASVRTKATLLASFPCGLIRGALSTFGIDALVSAELTALPGCQFTIKIVPPAPSAAQAGAGANIPAAAAAGPPPAMQATT